MAKKDKTKENQEVNVEDVLDLHPRPKAEPSMEFGTGTVESAEAMSLLSGTCNKSLINTTGSNKDEEKVKDANGNLNFIGNFHKGLTHNQFGEVNVNQYAKLMNAMKTPYTQAKFNAIPQHSNLGRKYVNPQAGLATDVEGPNPDKMKMRSAPKVGSAEAAAEAVELYWMALLRDLAFIDYDASPDIVTAANELSGLSEFTGPKESGQVTAQTIFRGCSAGSTMGPMISQFLLKDIPYGSLTISQQQETVKGESQVGATNADYLTDPAKWLDIQNGLKPTTLDQLDPTRRYIRNMRDLGHYVHVDALYEAYLNACLIILGAYQAPWDKENPYQDNKPAGKNQMGFGTFGGPHILSLVCEAATRALKAVWYQKWFVHRRLRPEAYGGLVHFTKTGQRNYALHSQVLNSVAVANTQAKFGTFLMPMAFPEGSPMHPAYGAGHATVAGACVTILKAFFDETLIVANPKVAAADGLSLVDYTGSDAGQLTLGGELNKVAANVAIGRNMAGVHWRSDYYDSIRLGERVAICILSKQKDDYNEPYSFNFTNFDGKKIKIDKTGVKGLKPGQQPCKDRSQDVL